MCARLLSCLLNAYTFLVCFFVHSKRGSKQNPITKAAIPGLVAFGAGVKMAETLEGRESPSSGTTEIVQKYSKASETSAWNFFVCLFVVFLICNVSHSLSPRRQELGTMRLNTLTFPYLTSLFYPGKGITFPSWMIKMAGD